MKLPISRPEVQITPKIKQRIINWLLSDEEVRIPAGVKFGPNSVTVGAPSVDDIQFDADGGLAQQDGTVMVGFPNDGTVDWKSKTLDNIASLSTEAIDIDGFSDGVIQTLIGSVSTAGGHGTSIKFQQTDGVSTSAKAIWDSETPNGTTGNSLVYVVGSSDGNDAFFYDVVQFPTRDQSPITQHSIAGATPAGRTYSRSDDKLKLAMASDTYNVAAAGQEVQLQRP